MFDLSLYRPIITFSNPTGPGVRDWRKAGVFNARINRHTGKPHEHKREIARRLRQAARRAS